jgi:methyl-accepting chemotaxis protein
MSLATQKEHVLSSDLIISSVSDLQGNIKEYNKGFREASGYTDEELQGKPHSLLRHPDMPKEAFQDFWATIQAGLPWFGIVKNKRKNGDHYWVAANASPIVQQGKITGYLSVRYPATREQVQFAERLYVDIRAGKTKFPWTKLDSGVKVVAVAVAAAAVAALVPGGLLLTGVSLSTPIAIACAMAGISATAFLAYKTFTYKRPSPEQMQGIESLANGSFRERIEGRDAWVDALNMVRSRIGASAALAYDAAKESAFLNTAMNIASTNLMVADADFNIVSINASLKDMFTQNESELRQLLPNFSVGTVVGSNMDIFHKNPAHQRAMVVRLTSPWSGELSLGDLVLKLTVVPIMSAGYKQGYVVEWLDRTQEVKLERQLDIVTRSSSEGVLHHRIDLTHANGIYLSLGKGINELLGVLSSFSGVIAHSVGELAFSRLNSEMTGEYLGAFRSAQNAINLSIRNLNELLGQVQYTSREVSGAMQQLSDGVNHFSDQTQEQAAAIEETAATMAEMLSTVKSNANNVHHANALAMGVHQRVEEGNSVMQQALGAMKLIHDSGSKIGDIVNLIDSIAFQTNLLALNAAVEAARAGEHGRGFAVVAAEVRALAQKSAEAAKDIKALIDASVHQISHGTQLVQKTSEALSDVRHSIDEMSSVVAQIAEASREQEKGIDEVNKAITVMDGVAQQSAALVEQTAASATHVASQMQGLDSIVRQFTLSSHGQAVERTGRTLLADMKQAHLNWNIRMSNVVHGHEKIADVSSVRNHQICGLGKWRNGAGRQFEHLPEMKQLDETHAKFHALVGEAVEAAHQEQYEIANERMKEVDSLSAEVVSLLEKLEIAISNSGVAMNILSTRPIDRKIAQQKMKPLPAPKMKDAHSEWGEF